MAFPQHNSLNKLLCSGLARGVVDSIPARLGKKDITNEEDNGKPPNKINFPTKNLGGRIWFLQSSKYNELCRITATIHHFH